MAFKKLRNKKVAQKKSINIVKSNSNTPERASARKVMSLKQHTATLTFLRSESSRRLMKLINFVRAIICFYRQRLNAYRLSLRSQM